MRARWWGVFVARGRGESYRCPECGSPASRHDSPRRRWRYLPGSRFTALIWALVIDWLTRTEPGCIGCGCGARRLVPFHTAQAKTCGSKLSALTMEALSPVARMTKKPCPSA